ncbi:MAG: hypothetical protein U1D66_13150 [Erythrobacter sp.]|nr:hypothetical protein [Erythrobacter sp.]
MTAAIPRLFADVTAKLEDMHAIAVDGPRRDNSADMQRVLACQLRMGIASLDNSLRTIKQRLGDTHD